MELLKTQNDIEIKLLLNRRFVYSNRRQNIVITAEHNATEITVLFPEEYEAYSKRVDFVNSHGKEWTEGLYIPEYKNYKGGFHKTRFHFTLPSEVTTAGELKMQFIAYMTDESMETVPFEVITIDVLDGVLAFKKTACSNPDLLILSYNQSTEALFHSQQAKAKAESNEQDIVDETEARAQGDAEIKTVLEAECAVRKQIDVEIRAALDVEVAERIAADLAETDARIIGDKENAEIIADEAERAKSAELVIAAGLDAEIERTTLAESNLAAAVDTEKAARIAGDTANLESIESEGLRSKAVESDLANSITSERERATQAENDLTTALATETARAKTAEASNLQKITDEATRAVEAESAVSADLSREITRVAQIESDLTDALNLEINDRVQADSSEQVARIQADSINAKAIADEVARATGVERGISQALSAEKLRAKAAEQANADAVQDECVRAKSEESSLQSELTTEKERATDAESELHTALNAEISRAKMAEKVNADAITVEAERAKALESELSDRITAEMERAQAAEKANADAITAEITRAQNAEGVISSAVGAEETRAKVTEQMLADSISVEEERAKTAEEALAQSILDNARKISADWDETDSASVSYIRNKPVGLPASDVSAWAKAASKPTYTPDEVGAATAVQGIKADGAEPAFTKNAAFNKNFGTVSGTVCQGDDSRLTNARSPTSHTHGNTDLTGISSWAKNSSKPTYTASEVGAAPKGMLLWKGSAESILGTSLAVSDWRERFSAVVIRFSGSYPTTTVIPLKDNVQYSEVTSAILNSASNFTIYSMNIKMPENSSGTISIHQQNYVSLSYGNWNYSVSNIKITSITGI